MLAKLLREEQPAARRRRVRRPGRDLPRRALRRLQGEPRPPMPDELRPQIAVHPAAGRGAPPAGDRGARRRGRRRDRHARRRRRARAGIETVIVTGDKDMMQLVDERTTLLDTMRDRRIGVAEVRGALRRRARRACPTCSGSWATRSTTSRASPASARRPRPRSCSGWAGRGDPRAPRRGGGERPARRQEAPRDARARGRHGAPLEDARHHPPRRARAARPRGAALGGPDRDALRALLAELEMRSLLRDLGVQRARTHRRTPRCASDFQILHEPIILVARFGHIVKIENILSSEGK